MSHPTEHYLKSRQQRVHAALDACLPADSATPERLHTAMRYCVFNGGKRLRPILVYAAGELLGVDSAALDAPACAVELIHTYSLVHDDLPAMDDDDLRRGKPTCHKAFDEATAILVGDALQCLAFELLAKQTAVTAEQMVQMIQVLTKVSGSLGMVGGQALDIAATPKTIASVETLYKLKTGGLITASIELGVLAAQHRHTSLGQALLRFAHHLGLAFQIYDDVLDIEADVSVLGKQPGSDQRHEKPTYPTIVGLAAAKQRVQELLDGAMEALSIFQEKAETLRGIAAQVLNRS